MSSILYYSNYCDKCKNILTLISKNDSLKKDIHFVCIDKSFRDTKTGGIYVTLETQQKILLPPQVQKVPAMLLLKEGNKVIFGNDVMEEIKPQQEYSTAKATDFNGEPMAFTLGNDNIGGFGVASDNFSYWDQGSDELLAEGNGGTRQMYNYATVNNTSTITTPKDDWTPDKVGETAMKDMEAERNKDLQMQHVGKQGSMMR